MNGFELEIVDGNNKCIGYVRIGIKNNIPEIIHTDGCILMENKSGDVFSESFVIKMKDDAQEYFKNYDEYINGTKVIDISPTDTPHIYDWFESSELIYKELDQQDIIDMWESLNLWNIENEITLTSKERQILNHIQKYNFEYHDKLNFIN